MKKNQIVKVSIAVIMAFSAAVQAKKTYVKRKAIKTPGHCESSFKAAKQSPSTASVVIATETCEKSAELACLNFVTKNSDGPGTGDYALVSASCDLSAAYGGNKAVNKMVASAKCEKAFREGQKSPSVAEVAAAADVCKREQDLACEKMVDQNSDGPTTGDGVFAGASCSLLAAHGAYNEVMLRSKASANPQGSDAGATQ